MVKPKDIARAVADFADELLADDRTEFTFEEAEALAEECGLSIATPIIRALKDAGFTMEPREIPKPVRGFTSNNHDRWIACPTHGGAAYSQMMIQKYGSKDLPF